MKPIAKWTLKCKSWSLISGAHEGQHQPILGPVRPLPQYVQREDLRCALYLVRLIFPNYEWIMEIYWQSTTFSTLSHIGSIPSSKQYRNPRPAFISANRKWQLQWISLTNYSLTKTQIPEEWFFFRLCILLCITIANTMHWLTTIYSTSNRRNLAVRMLKSQVRFLAVMGYDDLAKWGHCRLGIDRFCLSDIIWSYGGPCFLLMYEHVLMSVVHPQFTKWIGACRPCQIPFIQRFPRFLPLDMKFPSPRFKVVSIDQ